MDIKYEAVKAVFWNIGALVDLLRVKAFWRIACSKYPPLNPKRDLFHQVSGPNQILSSDTSWILLYKDGGTEKTNTHIHSAFRILRDMKE